MDQLAASELQATVASLGTNDGIRYIPDEDCVECVKDLIRFLRRDDENHEVRRALGDLGVVKSDLIPIIKDHSHNRELFDVTLRLLVNLTNPELLLFKEELPEDKETRNYYLQIQNHRQQYKQAFVDKDVWKIISKSLSVLLKKDWDERLEDDKLVLERILILIRNILQVPANVRHEGRTDGDATIHDQVLWVLQQSGIQDLLLYIGSADSEMHYCIHVLEIITLMLREQDPSALASSSLSRSEEEKQKDEEALRRVQRVEEEQRKLKARKIVSTRHSRFGGTYVLQNFKGVGEKELVIHKPIHDLQSLDLDKEKRGLKKAKNRRTPEDTDQVRRSTLAVRIFLKEFCVEFIYSAYNHLMNVVKDALNRQRAQLNDESYYLWAMKFFMEFNRGFEFKIELVSETLSKQCFHFLQQQIENYRDNFEFEKRNRPKYLMWAKRMHLAVRAYEELLLNLVQMEGSKDDRVREAGRVIRAGVFYEPEYRELCLQQLSSFNPDRMTKGYLTDLVRTTHVFLKLMEHMSKKSHLLVSKKTKKKMSKSGKKKSVVPPGGGERQGKEEQWDLVSPQLSSLLQGKGSLPTDVIPFDAASDIPIEDQKIQAMKRIQTALVSVKPDLAIALLRASREVWTEGDAFGAADSEAEDDFMALREILFADLGLGDQANGGEEGRDEDEREEEEEEDEDEEEERRVFSVEQEFDFKSFVARFAVKNVVKPFGILFSNYENNSKSTNHNIIKMFHRIAVDCGTPAILFQAAIFRVFQRIWNDLKAKPEDANLRELAKFGKFILRQFMSVAVSNKKVFMELLFWKTSRDALEIVEGYGTHSSTAQQKKSFWSEEDELKLTQIFRQVKEMEADNPEADILDQIESMYIHEKRTRRQIGTKLRDLGLITSIKEITRKPLGSRRSWSEEEIEKITQLYQEYKDAEHPANRIHEQWKMAGLTSRSKGKLIEKIMELGLCQDRSKLGRVRKRRQQKRDDGGGGGGASESDSALEDSSSGSEDSETEPEDQPQAASSSDVVGACRAWLDSGEGRGSVLGWLGDVLKGEGEDRETEDEPDEVPLVPLLEEQALAILDEKFQSVLESVGLTAPMTGEQYWRIPQDIGARALKSRGLVLRRIVEGAEDPLENIELDLLKVSRGLANIVGLKKKKKKKRGANKWQPFRREPVPGMDSGPTSSTPKPASKSKQPREKKSNKSFLNSDSESDGEKEDDNQEQEKEEDDIQDTENVENDAGKTKEQEKSVMKKKKVVLDKAKLLKLLNDEESDLSSDSDEDDINADSSNEGSSKKSKKKKLSVSSSDEGVDDPNPGPVSAAAKKKTTKPKEKKGVKPTTPDSSEDEGVEDPTPQHSGPIKNNELNREDAPSPVMKKGRSKSSKVKSKPEPKSKKTVAKSDKGEKSVNQSRKDSAKKKNRKFMLDSSDDENGSEEKERSGSISKDEDEELNSRKKPSIVSSDEEEANPVNSTKKTKRIVDSDSEEEDAGGPKSTIPQRISRPSSRNSPDKFSQSFDSRLDDSRINNSRMDDSRINDSRLEDSRLSLMDDSRLSIDSRVRSPRSPLSSRSPSRSVSRSRSRSISRSPSRSISRSRSRSTSPLSRRSSPTSRSSFRSPSKSAHPSPAPISKVRTPLSLKNSPNRTARESERKRKRGSKAESGEENSPVKPKSKRKMLVQSDSE